jgi:hypothetical protein
MDEIYIRMLADHQGAKNGDVVRFEHSKDATEVLSLEKGELVVPVDNKGERAFVKYVAPQKA